MLWLIWIVVMLAIPLAAGIWTLAGLRAPQALSTEEHEGALVADEA